MNQKEQFVNKLIEETESDTITWNIDSAAIISSYILNPKQLIQAYRVDRKGSSIFYVIQKYPQYHGDFDDYFDVPVHFISVLTGNALAMTITNQEVSEKCLDDLLAVIKNQAESNLLSSFLK